MTWAAYPQRGISVLVSNDHFSLSPFFFGNKQAFQHWGEIPKSTNSFEMSTKALKWYFGKRGGSPSSNLQQGLWSSYLHGSAATLSELWHSSDSTQDPDIFSSTQSSLRGDQSCSKRGPRVCHGCIYSMKCKESKENLLIKTYLKTHITCHFIVNRPGQLGEKHK